MRIAKEKRLKAGLRSPQISPKSQALAIKHAEINIVDRLLLAGKAKKIRKQLEIEKSLQKARQNASPKISKQSSNLTRPGTIEERLIRYKERYILNAQLKKDQLTSDCTFKPQINENWAICPPVELSDQYPKTPNPNKYVTEEFTYSPKINELSKKLAKWRSASPPVYKLSSCSIEEFTYKPSINQKSSKIGKRGNESEPRWKMLHDLNNSLKSKLQSKRDDLKQLEESHAECSFYPKINSCNASRSPSPTQTAHRLTKWLSEKELKLKEVKDQLQDKNISSCTFKPSINKPQLDLSGNKPEPKGVQIYLKRQDIIRRIKAGEQVDYRNFGSSSYALLARNSPSRFTTQNSENVLKNSVDK